MTGPKTRAELGEKTAISKGNLSKTISKLKEKGIVREESRVMYNEDSSTGY